MSVTIKRKNPRPGGDEYPVQTESGLYKLGDPSFGTKKHWAENAVYGRTIEEVAEMVRVNRFRVWMGRKSLRSPLISPDSLDINED